MGRKRSIRHGMASIYIRLTDLYGRAVKIPQCKPASGPGIRACYAISHANHAFLRYLASNLVSGKQANDK